MRVKCIALNEVTSRDWNSHFTIGEEYDCPNFDSCQNTIMVFDHLGMYWYCDKNCFEKLTAMNARCISKRERNVFGWAEFVSPGKEYDVIRGPYSRNGHSFIKITVNPEGDRKICDAECFKIYEVTL